MPKNSDCLESVNCGENMVSGWTNLGQYKFKNTKICNRNISRDRLINRRFAYFVWQISIRITKFTKASFHIRKIVGKSEKYVNEQTITISLKT